MVYCALDFASGVKVGLEDWHELGVVWKGGF